MRKLKKISTILLALAIVMCGILTTATTVEAATTKPTKITLSAKSKTIYTGQSYRLSVKKVSPTDASKSVTWKTSNSEVATVSSKGKVKAVKPGTATITAISKSNSKVKATCKITVKPVVKSMKMQYKNANGKYVTAPTTKAKALSLAYGKSLTLKAVYKPASSSYNWTKTAKWSVSSTYKNYVTISNIKSGKNYSTAVIKAKKLTASGKTIKVTAKATDGSGKSASMYLKITKANQTITTSAKTYKKTYGDSKFSLGAKSKQGGKLSYKVISGTSCVSVNKSGKVTIKQAGTAKIRITAAEKGNYAETTKDVTIKVAKAANPNLAIYHIEKRNSLSVTGTKEYSTVTYASSDPEVVKVDKRTGDYTLGKKAGIATITATVSETTNYLGAEITIEIVNPEAGYYDNDVWSSYRVYKFDKDKDYKIYADKNKVLLNYTDLENFFDSFRIAINGSFSVTRAWNACDVTDAFKVLSLVAMADKDFEFTGEETYTVVEDKANNSKTVTVANANEKLEGTYVMTLEGNTLHIVKDGNTKDIEIQKITSGYELTLNETINEKSVTLHILVRKTSESKMRVEFKVNDYNTAGLQVEETLDSKGIQNGWQMGIHIDGFNKYRSELGIDYTLDDIHVYPMQL